MLAPIRTVAPEEDPVGIDEIRRQLTIDHSEDDQKLEFLVRAATDHFDGWTGILGRALVTQTWRQDFANFSECMRLPLWPVQSVTGVAFFNASNAQETLASAVYELLKDALGACVALKPGQSWPSVYGRADAVSVTYVCGQPAASLPFGIKNAIIKRVMLGYDPLPPEARAALEKSIDEDVAKYRRVGI